MRDRRRHARQETPEHAAAYTRRRDLKLLIARVADPVRDAALVLRHVYKHALAP